MKDKIKTTKQERKEDMLSRRLNNIKEQEDIRLQEWTDELINSKLNRANNQPKDEYSPLG